MTTTSITTSISGQIQAAIQPQLDALEQLFHQYSPRIIGKHHPEYDTAGGRASHLARYLKDRLRAGYALAIPPATSGALARLDVSCQTPGCGYWDSGYDLDLIMDAFERHRAECTTTHQPSN